MKKPIYINGPIMDQLYKKASVAYATEVGIPDRKIRSNYIGNKISDDLDYYSEQSKFIPEILKSYPRINEIKYLLSC